jgi:hypothetical protein
MRITICTLALKYDTPDALQSGFQDYQKLMGRAEKGVFHNHTDPALTSGSCKRR